MFKRNLIIVIAAAFISSMATADCTLPHTHIGINQNQTPGDADDNKLWFFSMPGTTGWPCWGENIELMPFLGAGGNPAYNGSGEQLFTNRELGWHSAHPQHGDWQLGGAASDMPPDWSIALKRISFTESLIMTNTNGQDLLSNDGDEWAIGQQWLEDKYNENGTLGAWGFHKHNHWYAWGEVGDVFSATFQAIDYGTTGYLSSENYTINFETVPEPTTICLFSLGAIVLFKRQRKKSSWKV